MPCINLTANSGKCRVFKIKGLLLQAGLVPENIARNVCSSLTSLAARRQCPLLPGYSDGLHCLTRRHSIEALRASCVNASCANHASDTYHFSLSWEEVTDSNLHGPPGPALLGGQLLLNSQGDGVELGAALRRCRLAC